MPTRYQVIAAVWFLGLVNYFDRLVISFAGPTIMKSLAISPSSFGIVLSSFAVGYVISLIPGGLLGDRFGAKAVLMVTPLLWAACTALTGLAESLPAFIAVRFCLGVTEGLCIGSVNKVQADNFGSKDRALVLAIALTPVALAPTLAGPAFGYLLTALSWQSVFFLLAIPALFVTLVVWRCIPADEPGGRERTASSASRDGAGWAPVVAVLSLRSFWIVAVTWFLFNIAYWGYQGWMPSYLALERHIDVKSVGSLGGLTYAAALVGLLLFGWLASNGLYRYRPHLLTGLYVGAAASLYFAYSAGSVGTAFAGLSCAGFFLIGSIGVFSATALDLAPAASRATYWGAMSTVGQLAGIVAPAVIGFAVTQTGTFAFGFGFMVAALCVAVIGMFSLIPSWSATRLSPSSPTPLPSA